MEQRDESGFCIGGERFRVEEEKVEKRREEDVLLQVKQFSERVR